MLTDSNTAELGTGGFPSASHQNEVFYLNVLSGGGAIPEPTTIVIWSLLGAVGMVITRRRR